MMTTRYTYRWFGPLAITLLTLTAGVAFQEPSLVLAAGVSVAYVGYSLIARQPEVDVELERHISPQSPTPGTDVEITLIVRNQSSRRLFDLRVIDGVPPLLGVQEDSPRHATSLAAGNSTTFSYTVHAEPGRHSFEPVTLFARSVSETIETKMTQRASGVTELDCRTVRDIPAVQQSWIRTGRFRSSQTGMGIEYSHHREYRPGDPLNRIDWNTFARTGEFTTVIAHEAHTLQFAICLDARKIAYQSPTPARPHAVSQCVSAATELLTLLSEEQFHVKLGVFTDSFEWRGQASNLNHAAPLQRMLEQYHQSPDQASDSLLTGEQPVETQLSTLMADLSTATTVVIISPLLDEEIMSGLHLLAATGNSVLVVSPDITTTASHGQCLAAIQRANRLSSLTKAGIPVADWDVETSLGATLANLKITQTA